MGLGSIFEGRSVEDHACSKANSCRSTYPFQGFCGYRRLQWSCWSWCQVLQRGCYCYPWSHYFWPKCPLFQSVVASGVTKLVNPTPCPLRLLESMVPFG